MEDELKIAGLLRHGLQQDLFNVDLSYDGADGLDKAEFGSYDLIILDLMLPKIDGLTVCKKIRQKNIQIPIIILTAKNNIDNKVALFESGADDYVTKPFSVEEIVSRIKAILRREKKEDPAILKIGNLTLNQETKNAIRDNRIIWFTAREYALLEYLMKNKNKVLSKDQILGHVWSYQYQGVSNIVETYIKYLRKKLKVKPSSKELIHTVRGFGYVLKED